MIEFNDAVVAIISPVVTYWVVACFYDFLQFQKFSSVERYRIHDEQAEKSNLVSKKQVILTVLTQHTVQTLLGFLFIDSEPRVAESGWLPAICRLCFAMFILDSWQYFLHRLFHEVQFLYRNVHSWHHRLYVPYAYGALYNHPIEGILFDSVGGLLSYELSGISQRMAIFFFSFSTLKTVVDHCGYTFPINPMHCLFENNTQYHNVHHQKSGIKNNYSQPYFTFWDRLLGTYKAPAAAGVNGVRLNGPKLNGVNGGKINGVNCHVEVNGHAGLKKSS